MLFEPISLKFGVSYFKFEASHHQNKLFCAFKPSLFPVYLDYEFDKPEILRNVPKKFKKLLRKPSK